MSTKKVNPGNDEASQIMRLPTIGIPGDVPFYIDRFKGQQPQQIDCGKLDHYVLCWSSCGSGKLRLRFTDRDLPKGRLYFLRPGIVQSFLCYPSGGWLIRFRAQYLLKDLPERLQLHFLAGKPYTSLTEPQLDQLEFLALQLSHTANTKPNPVLIKSYLSLIAELAATFYREQLQVRHVHPHERMLQQLLRLIDQHYLEEYWTEFYAQQLGVVARKLNEISIGGTGFTVPELVEDRRLSQAELLLATSKLQMKEIAHTLGFISGSHFSFWFRQRRPHPPKAYRIKTLKEAGYR